MIMRELSKLSIQEKAKRYDEILARAEGANLPYYKEEIMSKVKEFVDYLLPELKESEDERVKRILHSISSKMSFHLRDIFTEEEFQCFDAWFNTWLEKQYEQKSTDKIKPKFHEGEWITNGDYTWQIVMIKSLDYILQSQGGNIVEDTISHVDEQFHSFTIQDAKDGDVLRIKNLTFIFQEIIYNNDFHNDVVVAHCSYEDNDEAFGIDGPDCITDLELITPATKQQCDLLFWKMKEAGYEWGVKKK